MTFKDQIFQGRLAKRLCIWGDEEYLECPFPKNFRELAKGKYRRSLDVGLNKNGCLVLTYAPGEKYIHSSDKATDLLTDALKVEVIDSFENLDIDYFKTVLNCTHEKVSALEPDPDYSFLERKFNICDNCKVVVSKEGSCARDACECTKHDQDYSKAKICLDW